MPKAGAVRIELVGTDGSVKVMKESIKLQEGEIIDGSFIDVAEYRAFLEREIQSAHKDHLLFSIHLKATMMKISDPVLFGHCVTVFFKPVFEKHAATLKEVGANPNNGWGAVLDKIKTLPEAKQNEINADIAACYENRPWLAMVDSGKGITNLHVPSDVIIDASMPCVVRDSGKMWNKDNALEGNYVRDFMCVCFLGMCVILCAFFQVCT
jgi:isocitrate dehydrogenase